MDSKSESSLQKGKKRKRTTLTEKSERFSEDSADLPHKHSRTASSTKQKACLSQIVDEANIGVQRNRTILEVLKISSPADVLKSLSLVNRQWMETCSSNELSQELWNTFLEDLCILPDSSMHPKATCAAYTRQQQTVVYLSWNNMLVLNKATEVWTPTMLPEPVKGEGSSCAVLFDGSVLCCGGRIGTDEEESCTNRAYRITSDGQVSALEPMITGRGWHGIAAYGKKVFVFGGRGFPGKLLTIERYDESSWSELPTKLNSSNAQCVQCIYKGLIYLTETFHRVVELFNPESLTIEILPTPKLPKYYWNAITVYEGHLVLIGGNDIYQWNIERNSSEIITEPQHHSLCCKKRTVLHGEVLYTIPKDNHPLMIPMKTFSREYFKSLGN